MGRNHRDDFCNFQAGSIGVHHDSGNTATARRLSGTDEDAVEIGNAAVGYPGLFAVQNVVIAIADGRRRQCPECGGRFSTIETASLNVIKRSGVIEPFSREKVMSGVRKACQGRPVTEGDLAVLAQQVEESVRQTGSSQVDTNEIGLAILGPLRELDEVAYLRFASVYQAFDSLEDFESAIGQLRADHPLADAEDAIAAES